MRAAMGFWSKIFTWWNGATVGTALWTRRFGDEVGRDDAGNVQPLEAAWNVGGYANNSVQRVPVTVV